MTTDQFFPTVQRLEKLVPELLQVSNHTSDKAKANCLRLLTSGVRRWVILRSLYDSDCDFFIEFDSDLFNCAEWLHQFQSRCPNYKNCPLSTWLFPDYNDWVKPQFITTLKSRYNFTDLDISDFLDKPIFDATDRTFRNHFTQLSKLKTPLIERQVINSPSTGKKPLHKFRKLSTSAILDSLATESNFNLDGILEFFTNEVSTIAELLTTKINGKQRLFIHHDYVVNEDLREASADFADHLKKIWNIDPTPPIQITYHSAFLNQTQTYIIYPVCLYFYQRAYYLCAFGERPQRTENQGQLGWYNYRLERITQLKQLSWQSDKLPFSKSEIIPHRQYSPDYIQGELDSAYGFDFYEPAAVMLLRFEADFAQRYIDPSFRHPTFEKLENKQAAIAWIKGLKLANQRQYLTHLKQFPNSAYYTLRYRQNDNNVIMRIRAWGANVEVILPSQLRQRIRQDSWQTWQLYQDSLD